MTSPLWAVLPGAIDDPAAPSGGNRYDRAVLTLLAGAPTHPTSHRIFGTDYSAPPPTDPPPTPPAGHQLVGTDYSPPSPADTPRAQPTGRQLVGTDYSPPSPAETPPPTQPAGGRIVGADYSVAQGGEPAGPLPIRDVHEVAIPGSWPEPEEAARRALSRALSEIPEMSVVLLDGLVACGVPEILAPHRERLRLAVLVHLPLSDETGLEPAAAARLREREGAALRMATTVIATSEAAAARIRDMHGLADVAVAAPGVDLAEPAVPDPAGRRLLCVAAVTPRKGQDLLVTALERHLADLDWECTFVGALIRPVPYTSRNIHFIGPRSGDALADTYGNADLFVLPSRAETYGMVVTEALAHGLPVIATEVGGVPEALGHAPGGEQTIPPGGERPGPPVAPGGERPGLLVPPDDPVALAAALRAWLTDPALRGRLRAAARARRGTLPTWTETAHRLSEVLFA